WGLVNNAGISVPTGPNQWLTKDDFAKVLNVNLLGLIEVTLSLLTLVRRGAGPGGQMRQFFFGGGYCISKFGVEAFSDSLRLEMRNFGVKVSVIEPGYFKTDMTNRKNLENDLLSIWKKLPEETKVIYGDSYVKKVSVALSKMEKFCNPSLRLVTDRIEHALTSCSPRTRYAVGWDARLLFIPLSYLPSALTDILFSCLYPGPARKT
ncbi:PREDICTED: retinol dehydrogenase 7-like, partial [Merops nubicus]|uniref:retinol dehydrogenase 7-like n=1 Tax=Merops nubicus TaxID=57421 RepID=UPI0004F047BD